MARVIAMLRHRIKRLFCLHNLKIGAYILLVSIVTGIILIEMAGLVTQPDNIRPALATGGGFTAGMDADSKAALKAQYDSLGSEEKAKIKEMFGK